MNRRGFLKGAALSLASAYVPLSFAGELRLSNISFESLWRKEHMAYLNAISAVLPTGSIWEYVLFTAEPMTDDDKVELYDKFTERLNSIQKEGL